MLKYELIENKEGKVRYRYSPEGNSDFGTILFLDGKCSIESLAKTDKHERYALKMFKKIREMAKSNAFANEGIIAWH